MLPKTMLLSLTAPVTVPSRLSPEIVPAGRTDEPAGRERMVREWIGRCEGFQVIGPDGRIGVVADMIRSGAGGEVRYLSVATGLFFIRREIVPVGDVASIDPRRTRVFVRVTPHGPPARPRRRRGLLRVRLV